MRKSLVLGLSMLVTLIWASLALAAEPAAAGASAPGLGGFFSYAVMAAGFGIGIAAFGTGIGQGLAVKTRWKASPVTPRLPEKSPLPC